MLLRLGLVGQCLIQSVDKNDPSVYLRYRKCEGEYCLDVGRFQIIYTPRAVIRRLETQDAARFHRAFPYLGPGDAGSDNDDDVGGSQSTP